MKSKPFNKELIYRAKKMRKNPTESEAAMWSMLRRKQMLGYKFRRQVPLLGFIVDFCCIKLKLVIEVDGASHDGNEAYDRYRQVKLEGIGCRFLRFRDVDVINDSKMVSEKIEKFIISVTN